MRGRQLKQDVIVNLVFTVVKIVALLWVTRTAGLIFLPAALSLFLLARRFSGTAANLAQLGVSQTLKRYVSMHADSNQIKRVYVLLAATFWVVLAILVVPAAFLTQGYWAYWLFPNTNGTGPLAFWTLVQVVASVLHFVVYSTLTAERRMVLGNVIELMSASGFLLLAVLFYGNAATPLDLMRFQSVAMVLQSLIVLGWYLLSIRTVVELPLSFIKSTAVVFVKYGIPRGFVTFLDMLIVTIGPWLLRTEATEVGYLLVALTVVRALEAAVGPISRVSLVVGARLVGSGNERAVGEGVRLLFGTVLYATTLAVAAIIPWLDFGVQMWLGDPILAGGVLKHVTVLVWGLVPLTTFYGLKEIIEIRWFQPLNVYTLFVGTGAQLLAFVALRGTIGLVEAVRWSTLLMFFILGGITLFWVRSYLGSLKYWGLQQLLGAAVALWWINTWLAHVPSMLRIGVAAIASVAVALCILISPPDFIRELRAFVLPSRQTVQGKA